MSNDLSIPDATRVAITRLMAVLQDAPPEAARREALALAQQLIQSDQAESAWELLSLLVKSPPDDAHAWQMLGRAHAACQRMPEAAIAFQHAASIESRDPGLALQYATASAEAGLPASHLFEHALKLSGGNPAAVAGLAASFVSEGSGTRAEQVLADAVTHRPDWLGGHKALTDLRWTAGDEGAFDRSYRSASREQPQNVRLRLAWFAALSQVGQWERAVAVLDEAEKVLGEQPGLVAARAFAASERGDARLAGALFARIESMARRDAGTGLAYLRHCLRTQQWGSAQSIVEGFLPGAASRMFWPYQSILWRLRNDPRAEWLDGGTAFVRTFDLGMSTAELLALAQTLRRLHTSQKPFPDQSVRGGTQTHVGRQLLFRSEPQIQLLVARVREALHRYVDDLPPHRLGHPLLGVSRTRIRFSGSWSVLLRGGGFHVSHTHPNGWISSALYVAVPGLGAAPAGWIRFGTPPATLGVDLPAYGEVEPKPGHLVLFPSTLWHQTVPFAAGERLVVAFDVTPPVSG